MTKTVVKTKSKTVVKKAPAKTKTARLVFHISSTVDKGFVFNHQGDVFPEGFNLEYMLNQEEVVLNINLFINNIDRFTDILKNSETVFHFYDAEGVDVGEFKSVSEIV